jgi:hypothetical protein
MRPTEHRIDDELEEVETHPALRLVEEGLPLAAPKRS